MWAGCQYTGSDVPPAFAVETAVCFGAQPSPLRSPGLPAEARLV